MQNGNVDIVNSKLVRRRNYFQPYRHFHLLNALFFDLRNGCCELVSIQRAILIFVSHIETVA